MSIYGHEYLHEVSLDILLENTNKLGFRDFVDVMKRWKTSNQNHAPKIFKANNLSDAEYEDIKEQLRIMKKKTVGYPEYKKAFEKFCRFINVSPKGTIIKKHKLSHKEDGKHELYVETVDNTRKISLPKDCVLYHQSQVDGIRKLLPAFKGKAVMGYMYYKPRIYFSIFDKMPKLAADYRKNEKVHMYIPKQKITDVYVDPLLPSRFFGAIYIETDNPLPVEQIS